MWLRSFMKGIFKIYCGIMYRVKVVGNENIPDEGAYILCANHVHAMDAISYVVNEKRMFYIMAKSELFDNKLKNWFFTNVAAFPIKRGKGDTDALDVAKNLLKDGQMLFIFPEGTRNGMAKGVRMKKGAAMLALAANAPIIPIGIKGDYKPFSKVRISVGKPISLEKYTTGEDLNPRDIVALTQEMQAEIVRLRDEE